MAQGRTVVEILHPEDHINLDNLNDRVLTLRQLQTALNALNIGVLGHQDTTVFVAQGGTQATGTVALTDVGGVAATGSYALNNVGGAIATGTVTFNGSLGAWTVTIRGVVFSGNSAGVDVDEADDLQTQLAASVNPLIAGVIIGTANGADVDLETVDRGAAGNAYTLAAIGTGVSVSGATFDTGLDGSVSVTINGTPVIADTTNLTDAAAAAAVAEAIEEDVTLGPLLVAVGSTTTVSLTWGTKGLAGNAVTLGVGVSATGTATRSGATLTGGLDGSVTITVNGTPEVTNTTNLTDATAATLCASELNANVTINTEVTAAADGADVVLAAIAYGPIGDTITLTSASATGTATASGATLTGGTDATGQVLERT